MSDTLVWASDAPANNKLSPSADKIKKGWVVENPPHEYFNWYMNRTDNRLLEMEKPVKSYYKYYSAKSRTSNILANAKFTLPATYIVGAHQLRVFLDGILCEPDAQYVECGTPGTESDYIRFLDDIDKSFDIRVEIPIRMLEPKRYVDDETINTIADLKKRVSKLEEPVFCTKFDNPAGSHTAYAKNAIYVLPSEYVVSANQLQVYINGILQYENKDYKEVGAVGTRTTDIIFLKNVAATDNIRVYISIRNGEKYTVLDEDKTLEALHRYVQEHLYMESRKDYTLANQINALADFTVPEYTVGNNGLKMYKNGILLIPNRDYSENGVDGERSTRIIWNITLPAGSLITAIAPYFTE